ncbi:transporter substrate-binding domain-containing protein [Microbacterium invictum]|uniref:Polar amino acid transport system substrate-binding protein n=1 Tax=Microbacterium invictum TaxID=515415 RepID=A0AA40SL99_9MICO|nr:MULTISPECIES: transporter substrate-binding domain-containing protein [Microbacterium]MBB4138210.1 polar amino acid transport system substrate-binding protein [Microbacterium invictum]
MSTSRTILRRSAAVLGAAALAVGVTACTDTGSGGDTGGSASDSASTLERLQDEGTITVAIADERPYSWVEGGEATGATIAMHKAIFAGMGIDDVDVVEVDWNSLIPGLKAGRYDAVSAGMSILPERCAEAAFSDPEIMYTTALMVPEGNPDGLTDLDSVQGKDDVTLAVLKGGIEAGYADKLDIADTVSVDNAQSGMDLVANGRADAFAMTAISLNWMADNNPDAGVETTDAFVQVIDGVEQVGAGSTVFRQGDIELLDAYNEQLATITGDVDAYMGLVGEFGFTEENLPPADLTTEQLCSGDLG